MKTRLVLLGLLVVACGSTRLAGPDGTSGAQSTDATLGFDVPDDWNVQTEPGSPSPGVEPLNVILSATSTVSYDAIFAALADATYPDGTTTPWLPVSVGTGLSGLASSACISGELSDVPVGGATWSEQALSFRVDGCAGITSTSESHARVWLQASSGAAFLALSNETPCLLGVRPWHCISEDGYDRGRDGFVNDLRQAGENQGWSVACQNVSRPDGIGLNSVAFDGVAVECVVSPLSTAVGGGDVDDAGAAADPAM